MRDVIFRLLYRIVRLLRPKRHSLPGAPTVLVLQYAMPLGCCVHGTPLYAAIKQAHPQSTIIVASRGLGLAALKHDPHVDYLLETPDPMASFSNLWKTVQIIRKYLRTQKWRVDFIVQDACNRRGMYALFALFLKTAPIAGFADALSLYDEYFAYDPELSLIDNNLRLVALLGKPQHHLEPAVYFSASELERVQVMLQEINPAGLPLVAFVMQGSGGQRTEWHDLRFVEVLQHVQGKGLFPVFVGTAVDIPLIERVRSCANSPGYSLAGRTSVPELAALLCLCDLVVTVDTGTMHVGRAVDVPMVVLGPSWQKPLEWLPLGKPNVRILRGADRDDVPLEYKLDEIASGDVNAAVDDLLHTFPPTAEDRNRRIAQRLSTTRI